MSYINRKVAITVVVQALELLTNKDYSIRSAHPKPTGCRWVCYTTSLGTFPIDVPVEDLGTVWVEVFVQGRHLI